MHSGHRRSAEAKCETLENNVLDTIKRYNMLESGDKVVVGVSGGPDSMTLLNILYTFGRVQHNCAANQVTVRP